MTTEVEPEIVGAVYPTEQLPEDRVQLEGENVPPTVSLKLTDPVGITPAPDPLS